MLREIPHAFQSKPAAQRALTAVRKKYRVRLPGSVIIADETGYHGRGTVWYVHGELSASGFSAGELASIFREMEQRGNPRHGTARDIPARWTAARVKRLKGGRVQIAFGNARRRRKR